jgi:hypothetical protein
MSKAKQFTTGIASLMAMGCALAETSVAQTADSLIIGKNAFGFHSDRSGLDIGFAIKLAPTATTFEQNASGKPLAVQYDQQRLEGWGLAENEIVIRRSPGLENAIALIHENQRLVVFDSDWYDVISSEHGIDDVRDPRFKLMFRRPELVLAHELGHHACGHTIATETTTKEESWKRELEADQFAGALLANDIKFPGGLADPATVMETLYIRSAENTYPLQGSTSHPPQSKRIEALWLGFHNGSPCLKQR